MQALLSRVHGGPDAQGAARFDFSTNSNAAGPCPAALLAVQQSDPTRYPDGSYSALRDQLAAWHAVDAARIVLAGSASEFIFRITALSALKGGTAVCLPRHSYGDYAQAAAAYGMARVADASRAQLVWACEPSSPLGAAHQGWMPGLGIAVLDRAYEPLRLGGAPSLGATDLERFWQLFTPNKALGLTGVRGAYAIAPVGSAADSDAMNRLCASWPLGGQGVAMLTAWTQPGVQRWLEASRATLRLHKARQIALCQSFGWTVLPSQANFFGCRVDSAQAVVDTFRLHDIQLRECTSFGLPGVVRLSVQLGPAQQALAAAWHCFNKEPTCQPKQ